MNSKYEIPESVVIVKNEHGTTATLRFKPSSKDRVMSSTKHEYIYRLIEEYVTGKARNVRKAKQDEETPRS